MAAATPGSLDPDFDIGLGAQKKSVIYGIYQESPTSFIVYGSFSTINGSSYAGLVRVNSTGNVDTSFAPPSFTGEIRAVVRRSDEKFLVGGDFSVLSGGSTYRDLALLSASGALDNSFWPAFAGQGVINALAMQSDDQVLCGGVGLQLAQVSTDPTRHLIRVQANGFADGDYPVFNGPRAYVTGLTTDSDTPEYPDRLEVFGAFNSGTTTQINWRTVLSNVGAVLSSQPDGASNNGPVLAVIDASGGKTYVVGNFTTSSGISANRILRRNSNGTVDATFNTGTGPNGDVTGALRLADDSLIVVGAFTSFNGTACNRIVHLLATGAVDTSFAVGSGANAPILAIKNLTSVGIALTGGFTSFNGQNRGGLAVVSTGGTLLGTFANFNPAGNASGTVTVNDLATQPDGKILIGGNFNWFGGVWSPNLARLTRDGAVDTTFSAGLGPDGVVHDVALRSDGLVFAAGDLVGAATRPLGGVARFTASGAVDTAFAPIVTRTDNSPAPIYAVLPLAGNQVLIGGHVRKIAGQERSPLARLNTDGGLDAAFTPQITITSGTGLSTYALAESSGKYYVGGYVTYESLARGFFTRVTSAGAIDTTFLPATPSAGVVIPNGTVREIGVQSDGKSVICGDFGEIIDNSWSRPQRRGLARFTTTGALDPFESTTGAISLTYVDSLSLEPDGKILFAGGFTKYNDVNRARLARTTATGALDAGFDPGEGVTARARVIRRVGLTRGVIGGDFTTYDGAARSGLAAFILDPQPSFNPAGNMLLLLN
ncbi:delta-60 repeat domain-containing protein [Desulfolutivibrio sp.]|uniref:delta-60 repeat domain-containing protein n=1 Tax=Desulfolutivibrio sp. TaxID=2773296 RepID=UPI002F963B6C